MQLTWREEPDPRQMARLLREHLRRAARWATALGCEESWPFFDIAVKSCPGVRAPDSEVLALEAHLQSLVLPERVVKACVWALHWDQIAGLPAINRLALPDPFEPLLAMFEQGGRFTTEHGYCDVGGAAFRVGQLASHVDMPEGVEARRGPQT